MLDKNVKCKIDVFLIPDYMEVIEGECELWEEHDDGRTRLIVRNSRNDSILCIRDHDRQPRCSFLNIEKKYGLLKSVDHIILTLDSGDQWTVHLIEMKTRIGNGEWKDLSQKVRASILNIKAVAAILDIRIGTFRVYTTYEQLSINIEDPTNIIGRKAMLGGGWKENEWDKNKLPVYIPDKIRWYLRHDGIKMDRKDIDGKSTLCGELVLS